MPYQAALEFQRNRLTVHAQHLRRFDDVRKLIDDALNKLEAELGKLQLAKRHAAIDAQVLLTEIRNVTEKYKSTLKDLEKQQGTVGGDDDLRSRLDRLLEGKIGTPPQDQSELDVAYKEAAVRFQDERPPGYLDSDKADGKQAAFYHKGLRYQRAFGDFLLWKQLKTFAREQNAKCLVLITDDEKPDWWRSVESGGKRTLGPRTELIDEMAEVGVETFHMYTSERFLTYAKEQVGAVVSPSSVDEVRSARTSDTFPYSGETARGAVGAWLRRIHPGKEIFPDRTHQVDFAVSDTGHQYIGYTVLPASGDLERDAQSFRSSPHDTMYSHYWLVVVTATATDAKLAPLFPFLRTVVGPLLSIVVGHLNPGTGSFTPVEEIKDDDTLKGGPAID